MNNMTEFGVQYSVVAAFCGVLLFAICISFLNAMPKKSDDKCLFLSILCAAIAAFAEISYGLHEFDVVAMSHEFVYFAYIVYTIASMLSGFFWLVYSEKKQNSWAGRKISHLLVFLLPYLAAFGVVISTPFTHLYFYFEDGSYARGPYFYIVTAISIVFVVFSGICAFIKSFRKRHYAVRSELRIVFMYILALLAVQLSQMFFSGHLPIRTMGATFVFVVAFSHYALRHIKTDPVSKVNNRYTFEQYLSNKLDSEDWFGLVMLDLDGFKAINEAHGRAMGDKAIMQSAKAICETVPNDFFVARVGGDEFAIVGTNELADYIEIEERINENLAEIQSTDGMPFTCTFSATYMIVDNSYDNIPDVLQEMDKRLNNRKSRKKA